MNHDQPNQAAAQGHSAAPHPHASDARRLMLGVVAGIVAGLALVGLLILVMRPQPLPPLTPESLQAARDRWEKSGPSSYDLELIIRGREPGKVVVEVRNGEVTRMTRDGREPDQRRTWQYWSVPAQFNTLEEELTDVHKGTSGFADSNTVHTRLEAQFDPKFGYPAHYRRIVVGNNQSLSWEVTKFQAVESAASTSPEAK